MKLDFYNLKGQVEKTVEVNDAFFAAPVNEDLIHKALLRQLANMRQVTAHTKGRSDRRGGGRKPWRQKGTGRARQGSIRAAQWIKGGRIFGPTNDRNYEKDMPKKQRRLALFGALTQKAQSNAVLGLSGFDIQAPKTKEAAQLLQKLPVERSVLVVHADDSEVLVRSFRNIEHIKTLDVQYLNVADLLKYRSIIVSEGAVDKMNTIWAS
ncbi:MAG: 50S ribosomal protein L4 [Patescibacteria group bacterium]|nr:50S ribosomal protein L4 [Patescibacteria group bacterium]